MASPITLEEAERLVFARVPPLKALPAALALAQDSVLAQDVASDIDLPPFNRATMDGFAVVAGEGGLLDIIEEVPAGHMPTKRVSTGGASRIMTGAPVPGGADAVEQIEKVVVKGGKVEVGATKPGQNIAARGEDIRAGQVVLKEGHVLRAQEIALLATVGCMNPKVYGGPTTAVLSTGDELVEPEARPGPGQIRESNSRSVIAQFAAMRLPCKPLGIVRDDPALLEEALREGLERDVLVITGGVSAGDRDLVVPTLKKLGVEYILHQVLVRPGRPFFFGTHGSKRVFALPGNPVSTFVTFELFVRPFVMRMMGHADGRRPRIAATLATPLPKVLDRIQFLPAVVGADGRVEILAWRGSGDQVTLTQANCLAIQPLKTALAVGDRIDVMKI